MTGPIAISTEAIEVELVYRAAGPAHELRVAGERGQIVAGIPRDVTLSRSDCTVLVRARLAKGRAGVAGDGPRADRGRP